MRPVEFSEIPVIVDHIGGTPNLKGESKMTKSVDLAKKSRAVLFK